jgi:hypothetical protein
MYALAVLCRAAHSASPLSVVGTYHIIVDVGHIERQARSKEHTDQLSPLSPLDEGDKGKLGEALPLEYRREAFITVGGAAGWARVS